MKRIDESEIRAARETPILEVWERLGLPPITKNGSVIRSPFREDNNPSLQVGGEKNIAYDHGTGECFDTIALVQSVRKCGFVEAIGFLLGGLSQ